MWEKRAWNKCRGPTAKLQEDNRAGTIRLWFVKQDSCQMENWHGVSSIWLPDLAFRVGVWEQRDLKGCPLLRQGINCCSVQYPSEQEMSWRTSEFNQTWKQGGPGAGFAVYTIQIMQLKSSTQCFGVWYRYRWHIHLMSVPLGGMTF